MERKGKKRERDTPSQRDRGTERDRELLHRWLRGAGAGVSPTTSIVKEMLRWKLTLCKRTLCGVAERADLCCDGEISPPFQSRVTGAQREEVLPKLTSQSRSVAADPLSSPHPGPALGQPKAEWRGSTPASGAGAARQ